MHILSHRTTRLLEISKRTEMKMKCKRQEGPPCEPSYKFLNKLTKTVLKQSSAEEEIKNVLNKATKFISCEACFLRVNFILFANIQRKK